jgi:putative PIN family toxin of toxin-antitoxin system
LVATLFAHHSVVSSREMFIELTEVLQRDKFGLKPGQIDRFLSVYTGKCEFVTLKTRFRVVDEDPDDDAVLNAAISGKAGYIITGDRHLLAVGRFRGVRMVTVDSALRLMRSDTV